MNKTITLARIRDFVAVLHFCHIFWRFLREAVKYYFADFVRKGGRGGTSQIRNPLFAEKKIRKRGGGGTPQIHNLIFGPKSSVFEQKTQFLALFEEIFLGKNP